MHLSNILGGIVHWKIIHHSISFINVQLVEQVVNTAYDSKIDSESDGDKGSVADMVTSQLMLNEFPVVQSSNNMECIVGGLLSTNSFQ